MEMPPSWFAMVSATRAELLNYNYLRILKTKTFPGAKFCNKFALSCLEFLVKKKQLFRISKSQILKWLFGPEKFTGLSRKGSQSRIGSKGCGVWEYMIFCSLPL